MTVQDIREYHEELEHLGFNDTEAYRQIDTLLAALDEKEKLATEYAKMASDANDQLRTATEALENLMDWQVKNVKRWNNTAYNEAAAALKEISND